MEVIKQIEERQEHAALARLGAERENVANMTDRKSKVTAGVSDDEALVRARQFLADHGIDHAAIIHREDAANFMVEFAALEREFSRQMELARQMMENRRDALRKLADS